MRRRSFIGADSWKVVQDVEFSTLTWVAWFNGSRLLEPLGYVPPIEFEAAFYARREESVANGFHQCPRIDDLVST